MMKNKVFLILLIVALIGIIGNIFRILTSENSKYVESRALIYVGEAGCPSVKNFGRIAQAEDFRPLFPRYNFANRGDAYIELVIRHDQEVEKGTHVESVVVENILPVLKREYSYYKNELRCMVSENGPNIVKMISSEINASKYKAFIWALFLFFGLVAAVVLFRNIGMKDSAGS